MTVATESGYQLEVGDLPLMENDLNEVGSGFTLEALGEGATFGNGIPVVETMQSLLRDGDLTSTTKYGNRIASFQVRVRADTYQGLADGEALIAAQMDRPNSLTWRVPHGAPATVFDVVRSWSEFVFEDLREVLRLERIFQLNFECLPDGRSEEAVSFEWSGPAAQLRSVGATTGWTSRSGGGTLSVGSVPTRLTRTTNGNLLLRTTPTVALRDFLYIRSNALGGGLALNAVVGGVAIPEASVGKFPSSSNADVMLVDVSDWRGQTPQIDFDIQVSSGAGELYGFWTTDYPNLFAGVLDAGSPPSTSEGASANYGIGVVDVVGTSRAPCTISFTAPAGGAWVYTAPDPVAALRGRGMPENIYGVFDVASAAGAAVSIGSTVMWFPQGSHHTQVGRTDGQPLVLSPDGVWPKSEVGVDTIGDDSGAVRYGYPADPDAAISFYDTSGAKNLVSPSPALPMGYHGGAVSHENHVLHPGRCGFAVLDVNGAPITATVTYYPRWKHHAAA